MNVAMGREVMDTINHTYVDWCSRIGVMPVVVPNCVSDPADYVRQFGVEGLILTGGNDVTSYGDVSSPAGSESPERDRCEQALVETALEANLTILGICRGLQFLNVYFGGTVEKNLSSFAGSENHAGAVHDIVIEEEGVRKQIGCARWRVNSFHQHGVVTRGVAPVLRVFARSVGGKVVEGLLHPTHRVMGIQWHPERPGSTQKLDDRLVCQFLDSGFRLK